MMHPRSGHWIFAVSIVIPVIVSACSSDDDTPDAGAGGPTDSGGGGFDAAGAADSGTGGQRDASPSDAGASDAGASDAGASDAAASDAAASDAAASDAGTGDVGSPDTGTPCTTDSCPFAPLTSALVGLTDRATTDLVLLDADRDQDLDIVWVSQWGYETNDPPGGVDLSIKTGNGTYQHQVVDDTSTWLFGFGVDVNGDGATDVVLSRAATTRTQIGLLLSNGAGGFTFATDAVPALPACGTSPCTASPSTDLGYVFSRVAAADFDRDGDMDLFVPVALDTNLILGQVASGRPDVLLINDGSGRFTQENGRLPVLTAAADQTLCAVAADFTSDGAPDIFSGGGGTRPRLLVNVETGGEFGTFRDEAEDDGSGTPRIPDVTVRAYKCGAIDLDADGDLDVVVVNDVALDSNNQTTTYPAYVFSNDGTGHFTAQTLPSPVGGPYDGRDFALGDINGDGRVDIVISNNAETVTHNGHAIEILLQQPDHSFVQVADVVSLPDNIFGVALTDVNGDGLLDIVAAVSKFQATGPGR